MPAGAPYSSFIKPYPIRVDEFKDPKGGLETIPALHLLTHTHSDHIVGLNAKSFGSVIVCSLDAKEMLLRHESYRSRFLREQQFTIERYRTYSHLKAGLSSPTEVSVNDPSSLDLLRALPLHQPTRFEISNGEWVIITLFDANHCPGAVMFLVNGSKGTILHTGDLRAEPVFIESLLNNPFLDKYLASTARETLDAIYLDTACLLRTVLIPTKQEATHALMEMLRLFPPHFRFFINAWTWGYEDILKAIARTFATKVHVDRYKYEVYTHLSDSALRTLVTNDAKSTRFHACERFDRCDFVRVDNPGIVYVNPVNMGSSNWKLYYAKTKARLERGDFPMHLLVPLHRHSSLPELQTFVGIFKPKRLVPNCLVPCLHGLDWACMPSMFGPFMSGGGANRILEEIRAGHATDTVYDLDENALLVDSELENIEAGRGTDEMASLVSLWASEHGLEDGKLTAKPVIQVMQKYLPKGFSLIVERALRNSRRRALPAIHAESEDEDSDSTSDEEGHQRAAETFFGGHTNLPNLTASPSFSPAIVMNMGETTTSAHQCSPAPSLSGRTAESSELRRLQAPMSKQVALASSSQVHCFRFPVSSEGPRKPGAVDFSKKTQIERASHALSSPIQIKPRKDKTQEYPSAILKDVQDQLNTKQAAHKFRVTSSAMKQHKPLLKRPGSPQPGRYRKNEKRERREERIKLAKKLAMARPDLAAKKQQQPSSSKSILMPSQGNVGASFTFDDNGFLRGDADDLPMDWARSRALERQILEDMKEGKKPKLPVMKFVLERFGIPDDL